MRVSVRCIFFVFLLTLVSATAAHADTSSLIKLAADDSGFVEIPIQGTGDTYWMLLNECVLVREGKANAGEKITYRPGGYGDIFFFQQFAGDKKDFAEALINLRLIENNLQCWEKGDIKTNPTKFVTKQKISKVIKQVYSRMVALESDMTFTDVIERLPKVVGTTCPDAVPTNATDTKALEECVDVGEVANNVVSMAHKLDKYPTGPLIYGATSTQYSVRKQFSTFTIKSSLAFAPPAHTALTTAYISVYPTAEFISSENLAWLDRISLDFGVVTPRGETASEDFINAEERYMVGVGFDLSQNFSIHIADVITFDNGDVHQFGAVGVSVDVLNLIGSLNK